MVLTAIQSDATADVNDSQQFSSALTSVVVQLPVVTQDDPSLVPDLNATQSVSCS